MQIQSLITTFMRKKGQCENVEQIVNIDKPSRKVRTCAPLENCDQSSFVEFAWIPVYYNNVRSITNKHNICMKIDLSVVSHGVSSNRDMVE